MSEPSPRDPLIGMRLNEYEVLEAVAEGGMGVVYRGLHPVINKRVAIKVLKAGMQKEDASDAQLAAEAQAVNAIGHRNIVDIFGIGHLPDGRSYIIMEYLEGKPLDLHAAQHPLALVDVVQILFDLCAPLGAAHKKGVIHRDLKPSNVFLCTQPDGGTFLKLLDFGLSKRSFSLDGVTEQTARATVAGTPDFMAPEQAQGKAVSPRTDLYALGCIGFQLATGATPYKGQTPFDVMVAHVRAPVPRASSLNATIPPALDELLFRLMQKRPDDRPQSADEVRDALQPILEHLGTVPSPRASGPRPAMSGASVLRAARASGLKAALPAAPPTPAPASTAAEREQTEPELARAPGSRTPLLIGGLLVVVLSLGAGLFFLVPSPPSAPAPAEPLRAEPAPPPAPPPAPEPAGPTPTASPAPPAAQTAPASPPPEEPVAAPAPEDEADELVALPAAPVASRKAVAEVRAPSELELKKRLDALEARLRKASDAPDPAALQVLSKYRVQATMADGPPARAKLARQLDQWERLFLR